MSISSPSHFFGSILSRARRYECAPWSSISYQRLQQTPWNNSASKIGERISLQILRVLPRPARRVLHNGKAMQQSHNKGAARRCASRDSTNQNALFFRVIFSPGKSHFQRCIWWNFCFIPSVCREFWHYAAVEVVGTLYLDSGCTTFMNILLSWVFVTSLNCSVMCKPLRWFECYFRRSSWIHCWLLLAVLSD